MLRAAGDDDVVSDDVAVRRREPPGAVRLSLDGVHRDAGADRDAHPLDVALEVVTHLGAGGIAAPRRREGQPGEPVVLRRGVQQQRVVPLAPLVADALVLVEDDARDPGPAQEVGRGEAGLAGPDDDRSPSIGLALRLRTAAVRPFRDGHGPRPLCV